MNRLLGWYYQRKLDSTRHLLENYKRISLEIGDSISSEMEKYHQEEPFNDVPLLREISHLFSEKTRVAIEINNLIKTKKKLEGKLGI